MRARSQVWFDFISVDLTVASELRQYGGVITASRTNVYDRLSRLRIEQTNTVSMQAGLSIVYSHFWNQPDNDIAINLAWIIRCS